VTDETTSIWSDIWTKAKTAWAWLDKPAQWLAAAVAWSPKTSLLVAAGVVIWALV
jgi:hypothetical protein